MIDIRFGNLSTVPTLTHSMDLSIIAVLNELLSKDITFTYDQHDLRLIVLTSFSLCRIN